MDKTKIDEIFFKNLKKKYKGLDFYFSLGFFSVKLKLNKDVFDVFSKKFKNQRSEFFVEPEIFESPINNFNYLIGNPAIYNITFKENKNKFIFYAYNFASILNLKKPSNCILALGQERCDIIANEIENFLRVYSSIILPNYDSILFHSSAVLTKKGAFVFFGNSGAGKSTIANIFRSENFKVLSDDLNILILKNGLQIASSPFLSEIDCAEEGTFPVKKIFYLKKDKENFIEKISPIQQKAYFFASIPVLNYIKFYHNEIFLKISEIINYNEVEVLHFKKDKELIKCLQSI